MVVAAFVLVFVGLGTWYIQRSEASSVCVYQNFGRGSSGTCVKAIQSMVDHYGIRPILKTCPYGGTTTSCRDGYYDGIYGSRTAANVKTFQYYAHLPAAQQDGVVGSYTWGKLCTLVGPSDINDYNRAGCYAISSRGLY